jgi:hypothetical protein
MPLECGDAPRDTGDGVVGFAAVVWGGGGGLRGVGRASGGVGGGVGLLLDESEVAGRAQFQRHRRVALSNGVLHVQLVQMRAADPRWGTTPPIRGYPLSFPFLETFLGFSLYLDAPGWYTGGGSYREFSVPVWVIVGLLGMVPVQTERRRRKRMEMAWIRCRTCGYDLTGNVSGVCSECGTGIGAGARG